MWFIKRLLRLDMSKDIPEQVRRLFGISFTPILPIHNSKSETGFVTHDPFQITFHQLFFSSCITGDILEERPSHISPNIDFIITYSFH
jgi:hypothetical protein